MKTYQKTAAILCSLSLSLPILAGDHSSNTETDLWDASYPDSHAPIGVMGDHTHGAGEYMLSYRFMNMAMKGHRQGTQSLSAEDVFGLVYDIAALDMTMDMHMIGMMHAPTDKLTLMAMVNFVAHERSHDHGQGHGPWSRPMTTTKTVAMAHGCCLRPNTTATTMVKTTVHGNG